MNIKQTLYSIGRDFLRFFNIRSKKGLVRLGITLAIVGSFIFFVSQNGNGESELQDELSPQVEVITVNSLSSLTDFTLVGSVEAKSQARIQTEAAGRVTQVNYELGAELPAGAIIAQLENASQYASVLQAEGAYEAALASAAQSGISVADANNSLTATQNTVKGTLRSSFTTVNDTVLETIDDFYSDLDEPVVGVSIDVGNNALRLITERKSLTTKLEMWRSDSLDNILVNQDDDIAFAEETTRSVLNLIDEFISFTNAAGINETVNGVNVNSYTTILSAERAKLVNVLSSLDAARTNLVAARDAVRKAEIGGGDNENTAAQAQVKQALGSLRAAQANYNKTILRTPISGTLNELSVKTGDFVGMSAPVALVANNNALEITVFAGETDAARVYVGQTVTVDGTAEGVITAVAPAIDTATKKTEIKIASEDVRLKTGDSVTITFSDSTDTPETATGPLLVPITAIKFSSTDGTMFVVENDTLVAVPVEVGPISGSNVTILSGIDRTTEFVRDARGLSAGLQVEPITR